MENASKALIMAAGVLIGLMVISLGVYLFYTFSTGAKQVHAKNEQTQIEQFNNQFLKYNGLEINIYDVVTIANLAAQNNYNYNLTQSEDNNFYINVTLSGSKLEKYESGKIIALIEKNSSINSNNGELEKKFKCIVTVSSVTGRVKSVTLSESK